jgi:hypothetical protein
MVTEVPRSTEKYEEVPRSTKKYEEVQEVQKSAFSPLINWRLQKTNSYSNTF